MSALRTGRLYPRKLSWYSFLLEDESIQIENRQLYTKEGKIHKTIQNQRIHKIENKKKSKKNIKTKVEQLENNKEKQIIMTQRTAQYLLTAT